MSITLISECNVHRRVYPEDNILSTDSEAFVQGGAPAPECWKTRQGPCSVDPEASHRIGLPEIYQA